LSNKWENAVRKIFCSKQGKNEMRLCFSNSSPEKIRRGIGKLRDVIFSEMGSHPTYFDFTVSQSTASPQM